MVPMKTKGKMEEEPTEPSEVDSERKVVSSIVNDMISNDGQKPEGEKSSGSRQESKDTTNDEAFTVEPKAVENQSDTTEAAVSSTEKNIATATSQADSPSQMTYTSTTPFEDQTTKPLKTRNSRRSQSTRQSQRRDRPQQSRYQARRQNRRQSRRQRNRRNRNNRRRQTRNWEPSNNGGDWRAGIADLLPKQLFATARTRDVNEKEGNEDLSFTSKLRANIEDDLGLGFKQSGHSASTQDKGISVGHKRDDDSRTSRQLQSAR